MFCSVTLVRRDGVRLRSSQLQPAVYGNLVIADSPSMAFKRAVRVATLHAHRTGTDPVADLLTPIFDPVVTSIGDNEMAITGIQLQHHTVDDTRQMAEHIQVWWVRHFGQQGPAQK